MQTLKHFAHDHNRGSRGVDYLVRVEVEFQQIFTCVDLLLVIRAVKEFLSQIKKFG